MEDSEPEFSLGCMFWAKVSKYPWWPCMIYNSPSGDGYVRNLKTHTKYHVQFFGPHVERAWVPDSHLIPYKSRYKLESQLEKLHTKFPVCFDVSYFT